MADAVPDSGRHAAVPAATRALPARCYVEPGFAALDLAAVLGRGWHLLAHHDRLREPGDHVVADCGGLPAVAVRGDDGTIRAFHNVCRHRAGPLARCDGRDARGLRCLYHGWRYGLDGVLRSAPEMDGTPGFDPDGIRLPELAVRTWQGLVFACQDPAGAPAFEAMVAGLDARLGAGRDLAGYGHHRHVHYDIACNWKAYVDNFLEGYHLPHVHPALNRLLDYRSYLTETGDWHALQWSPLEGGGAPYADGEALYYWLWPNTMLNILPGRLQTNQVLPLGPERCRVAFDYYYPGAMDAGEAAARFEADAAFSDEVQREDVAICEDVQRGLASGSYVAGLLNPLREQGVAHFHRLVREAYARAGQPLGEPDAAERSAG